MLLGRKPPAARQSLQLPYAPSTTPTLLVSRCVYTLLPLPDTLTWPQLHSSPELLFQPADPERHHFLFEVSLNNSPTNHHHHYPVGISSSSFHVSFLLPWTCPTGGTCHTISELYSPRGQRIWLPASELLSIYFWESVFQFLSYCYFPQWKTTLGINMTTAPQTQASCREGANKMRPTA